MDQTDQSLINSREELDALLEKARIFVEKMSPIDRASMIAVQAFGWMVSESIMSIHEEAADPVEIRQRLAWIKTQVANNVTLNLAMIGRLTDSDRKYVIQKIEAGITEIDALMAQAS